MYSKLILLAVPVVTAGIGWRTFCETPASIAMENVRIVSTQEFTRQKPAAEGEQLAQNFVVVYRYGNFRYAGFPYQDPRYNNFRYANYSYSNYRYAGYRYSNNRNVNYRYGNYRFRSYRFSGYGTPQYRYGSFRYTTYYQTNRDQTRIEASQRSTE